MLRTLRGVLGTAITWAIPWSILGGTALAVLGYAAFSRFTSPPPRIVVEMFLNGALVSGIIGALSGAVFAATVAVRERRSSFSDLSFRRMIAWGAIGGGTIALGLVGVVSIANAQLVWSSLSLVGLSSVLGAASAASMLSLARRSRELPDASATQGRLE